MGNRLSKIYTKTGDDGSTGLGDGTRVPKDHPRVEAYGTVDELNSAIGMLLSEEVHADIRKCLTRVQHELLDLGGELCIPGFTAITPEHVARLEQELDGFNAELPPLKEFILPGGSRAAAVCHLARTVCRRAERRTYTLHTQAPLSPQALEYLNRLSDLLFVLGRVIARHDKGTEVLWDHERKKV